MKIMTLTSDQGTVCICMDYIVAMEELHHGTKIWVGNPMPFIVKEEFDKLQKTWKSYADVYGQSTFAHRLPRERPVEEAA